MLRVLCIIEGTLPHRKFYDVEMYERRKFEKSSKKTKPKEKRGKERLTFNDEEEKRHELARERAKQQEDRVKEAYEEMMHGAKAEDMREQVKKICVTCIASLFSTNERIACSMEAAE